MRIRIVDSCLVVTSLGLIAACSLSVQEIRSSAAQRNLKQMTEYLRNQHSWVREEAALALAQIDGAESARILEPVVLDRRERAYVRAAAARSLGRIRDPGSFEVLVGAIASPELDPDLKVALMDAICSFPNENEALQAIAPLVDDEDMIVSAVADARVRFRCKY